MGEFTEKDVDLFAAEIIKTAIKQRIEESVILRELMTDLHISEFKAKLLLRKNGVY